MVKLFTHTNLYIRSQSIDSFYLITSHPDFDWFVGADGGGKEIHRQLQIINKFGFIDALLFNANNSYPGGSYICLQILAFWLSWIRLLYTENNQLFVTEEVKNSNGLDIRRFEKMEGI